MQFYGYGCCYFDEIMNKRTTTYPNKEKEDIMIYTQLCKYDCLQDVECISLTTEIGPPDDLINDHINLKCTLNSGSGKNFKVGSPPWLACPHANDPSNDPKMLRCYKRTKSSNGNCNK